MLNILDLTKLFKIVKCKTILEERKQSNHWLTMQPYLVAIFFGITD